LPKDQDKLRKVVRICCLDSDISLFSDGLKTEIGERGVNLSGGQKSRLCLARALYADADIYLLDDPLSSSDAKISKKIFEGLTLALKGKTVLLATHSLKQLAQTDKILFLQDGKMKHFADFKEISALESQFFDSLTLTEKDQKESERQEDSSKSLDNKNTEKKYVLNEEEQTSYSDIATYKDFGQTVGWGIVFLYIVLLVLSTGASVAAPLWLAHISAIPPELQTSSSFYIYVSMDVGYILLFGISCLLTCSTFLCRSFDWS